MSLAYSRGLTLLFGALAFVACGGDEPEVEPEDPNLPLEGLCAAVAEADCARLSACGALYAPFDETNCRLHQAAVLCGPVQAGLSAAVAGGSLDYFQLAARDCQKAVGKLSCDIGFDYDLMSIDACLSMVSAIGTVGDTCHLGFDCAEGHYCDNVAACPGRCAELKTNNQPCTFGERCASNLYCELTAMRCLARTDLGGTCGLELAGSACVDGTFCDRSNPATPSCVRARGRNEGCTSGAECAGGALCLSNRCSAGLEEDACEQDYHCTADRLCFQGGCRLKTELGGACGSGTPCASGLTCTSSLAMPVCQPQGLSGASCAAETPCLGGACVNGTCGTALEDGAACTQAEQCLPLRACTEGRCTAIPRDCRY